MIILKKYSRKIEEKSDKDNSIMLDELFDEKGEIKADTIEIIESPFENINDEADLEMLNKLIAIDRLNKNQILQMVNLVSLSNDINDLKDNLKWESAKSL